MYLYAQCRLWRYWSCPPVCYSLDEYHPAFPGEICVVMQTALAQIAHTAFCVARHGPTHIPVLNGHGPHATIAQIVLHLIGATARFRQTPFGAGVEDCVPLSANSAPSWCDRAAVCMGCG